MPTVKVNDSSHMEMYRFFFFIVVQLQLSEFSPHPGNVSLLYLLCSVGLIEVGPVPF